jgi:hypothetical protein
VKHAPIAIMDEKSHWLFSVKKNPPTFEMPKPFGIDPAIVKSFYEERYKGNPCDNPIAHLDKFEKYAILLRLIMLAMRELKLRCFFTHFLLDHWICF